MYATKHLGSAPIYVIQIPTALAPQIARIGGNVNVDFVQPSNNPPFDVISPDVERNIEHFFQDKKPIFSLGDVILTYTNSEGQIELIQYIPRYVLTSAMQEAYTVVNSMIFRHSSDSLFADNNRIRDYFNTLRTPDGNTKGSSSNLYSEGFFRNLHNTFSLFLRPALHKSISAQSLIQLRIQQSKTLPERRLFTLETWPQEQTKEKTKFKGIQYVTDRLAHPFNKAPYLTMTGMIYALSLTFPETFSTMLDFISNASTNYNIQQNLSSTSSLAIEHLILFTIVALWALRSAMWAGYKLPPLIQSKLPDKGKWGRYKKRAQMALERIKKQKEELKYQEGISLTKNWLTLFGNKAGYLMPAFYRLFPQIAGQPLFFHTLEQGFNPFSKIQKEDGKTVRLGITPYRFTKKSKAITDHLEWQDEFIEKWKRLRGVAHQLANMALRVHLGLVTPEFANPRDVITWGPSLQSKAILQSLENKHDSVKQQWVALRLMAEMLETKLYKQVDLSKHHYINPEYLDTFYERAQYFVFSYEKNSKMIDQLYQGAKELIQDHTSSPEKSSTLYERAVAFVQEYESNESNELTLQLYQKAQALVQEYQNSHTTDRPSIQQYSQRSLEPPEPFLYMVAKQIPNCEKCCCFLE